VHSRRIRTSTGQMELSCRKRKSMKPSNASSQNPQIAKALTDLDWFRDHGQDRGILQNFKTRFKLWTVAE